MNRTEFVESVVSDQLKAEDQLSDMTVGDTVDVHYRIVEGDKERIQVFQGVLIGMKGRGINRTITIRRIVANEGVERIFPLHSPRIAKIEVVRRGDARRRISTACACGSAALGIRAPQCVRAVCSTRTRARSAAPS